MINKALFNYNSSVSLLYTVIEMSELYVLA